MGVDTFPIAGQLRELFLYGLLLVEAGLTGVEERCTDQHVRYPEVPLHESERRVAMQRGADEGGGSSMPVEQNIFPGNEHVVENDQRIDLIEAVGKRIILGR